MIPDSLKELIARLSTSTAALAAIGTALDAHSGEALPDAAAGALADALGILGVSEALAGLSPAEARGLLTEIRLTLLGGARTLYRETREGGWKHLDPQFLQLFGDASSAFAHLLKNMLAPQLPGLSQRLDSADAAFLDIGVGVAGLAIEMARTWPALRVVGLDVWAPSLALARDNVQRAGLGDRIELRQQGAEALTEQDAYDLVWLPSIFIPQDLIPAIVERAFAALRPGGYILFATANPTNDPLLAALMRLRASLWGGNMYSFAESEPLLRGAGFTDVRAMPSPPTAVVAMTVARRAPLEHLT